MVMNKKPQVLSPTVQWAQRKEHILLKVMLNRVESPKFDVQQSGIAFTGKGHGAKGLNNYAFQLKFYKDIVEESFTYDALARCVEVKLEKKEPEWWPRLLPENLKTPHFLKVKYRYLSRITKFILLVHLTRHQHF